MIWRFGDLKVSVNWRFEGLFFGLMIGRFEVLSDLRFESLRDLNVWMIWKFEGLSDLKIENEFARIIVLEMMKQTLSRKEMEDKTWLQISTGRWIQAESIIHPMLMLFSLLNTNFYGKVNPGWKYYWNTRRWVWNFLSCLF